MRRARTRVPKLTWFAAVILPAVGLAAEPNTRVATTATERALAAHRVVGGIDPTEVPEAAIDLTPRDRPATTDTAMVVLERAEPFATAANGDTEDDDHADDGDPPRLGQPVPEFDTWLLLGLGVLALAFANRRRLRPRRSDHTS